MARALTRQTPNFPPDLLSLYRRNITQPGAAKAMLNYYRANATRLSSRTAGSAISIPTLLIWGEHDVALDLTLSEGNEAFVRDLTVRRLPGISHWVQEDAPEDVVRLISEWAQQKGLASAPQPQVKGPAVFGKSRPGHGDTPSGGNLI